MKPLNDIANQVQKVELSWPATLPLPRIAPLMNKVASMLPPIPGPISRVPSITPPLVGAYQGMITNIDQIQGRTFTPAPAPAPAPVVSQPLRIFEPAAGEVITELPQPEDFTQGLMQFSFE